MLDCRAEVASSLEDLGVQGMSLAGTLAGGRCLEKFKGGVEFRIRLALVSTLFCNPAEPDVGSAGVARFGGPSRKLQSLFRPAFGRLQVPAQEVELTHAHQHVGPLRFDARILDQGECPLEVTLRI